MLKKILSKISKKSVILRQKINLKKFSDPMDRFFFDQFVSSATAKGKASPSGSLPSKNRSDEQSKLDDGEEKSRHKVWAKKGDKTPGAICGLDRMNNPGLNKSLAFTIEERQLLGIHGLLPPVVKTQEQQIEHCKLRLERLKDSLDKYIYLMGLLDFNEKLLYAVVRRNISEIMPLLYTPTVGTACLKWGLIYRRPRGIYITLYDKGHVYEILKNFPESDVRVIVVTDGERILGLGDQGACGMGIPIGKLALYTALAGIKPNHCLPITIDVGTNNQEHLKDSMYPGIKEKRRTGPTYDELIDEFMHAVVHRWGQNCLIQFEDFGNKNAFRLLDKYRDTFCTFNDDIQGTASVAVAGVLAALRITKKKLFDNVILFCGAGEANIGIATLCVMAMISDGKVSEASARKKIWMLDSKGLIVTTRQDLEPQKLPFAQEYDIETDLIQIIKTLKPTILIGAAACPGVFTPAVLKQMAENCESPIIFALSNPTSKAECTPTEAFENTGGTVIYASGSPFPPVEYNGKTYVTGQCNNAYIFPAIGLATICAGIQTISEDYFLIAAEALASQVQESDLAQGSIYPPIDSLLECSTKIATRLVEYAYRKKAASVMPEPSNKEAFVKSQMYNTDYEPAIPISYQVPLGEEAEKKSI